MTAELVYNELIATGPALSIQGARSNILAFELVATERELHL